MSPSLERFVASKEITTDLINVEMILSEGIKQFSLKQFESDFPDEWWEKGEIVEIVKVLVSTGNMWLKASSGVSAIGPRRRFLIRKFPVDADIFESKIR